jgi:transcriptional regulator with XRE-family HTH domain
LPEDSELAAFDNAKMAAENHLKAWREHRRMTQEQLAEAIGTRGSVISLLESGDRRLSDKWLRRLAPALETTPGHLLDCHPDDVPNDILEIWASIPDERKAQAIEVLNTFRRAG